jgi:hypothetical protein
MEDLFLPLMGLGLISPIASIAVTLFLFFRRCERVEPERRVSTVGFVLAVIFFAVIGGFLGVAIGVERACPRFGNLCGLWAVFITGPICFSLGVLLPGILISLIPAAARPDDNNLS